MKIENEQLLTPLTEEYILSKGFIKSEPYSGYVTWSLPIADVVYHISFFEWRGDYSVDIEYTDPISRHEMGKRYGFGCLSSNDDLDSFLKIMSYRDMYEDYMKNGHSSGLSVIGAFGFRQLGKLKSQ